VYLQGRKAWCSGAAILDRALVTVWDEQLRPQLVAVALQQPTIRMLDDGWQAVGMGSTASIDVLFEGALGRCVGSPGQYVDRPGFWHGGAGIAACWYGAACALADYLRQHCTQPYRDAHAEAHLGAVDAALGSVRAALRETALWIDDNPRRSAQLPVRRLRAQVEVAVDSVLAHVGRGLGATPFCRDSHFARLAADLPVFVRQSHAEKDLAQLGQQIAAQPLEGWLL
jgi:alkylation response protein AidB-like acyl-CoA dehydrogenase